METENLQKEYEKLAKKYKLPAFDELNENFEISKIEKDSGILLKSIRKVMMEKIINALGFFEMLLNPMNVPRMYYSYVKSMGANDKKSLEKVYSDFGEISFIALEREVDYSEKGEAELIKKIFEKWHESKPEFVRITRNMRVQDTNNSKKEKSYFG